MHDLLNLNKFLNNAIGFEDVFERLSSFNNHNTGFPYYNIKKKDSDKYSLEMTLAGYKKEDINVTVDDGVLTVKGKSSEEKEKFVHRGIAKRAFMKQLQLSEYVECKGAKFEDGMLKVDLEYNPPEDKRAKLIEVK